MVGDDDGGPRFVEALASHDAYSPDRVQPGVERGPERSEAMKDPTPIVECDGRQPEQEADRKEQNRRDDDEAPEEKRAQHSYHDSLPDSRQASTNA